MPVRQICARNVDVATTGETVVAAARRMQARKVGTLVVVNASNEPIGLVTDRDLTIRVLAASRDPWQSTVLDVMTESPRTVAEDMPIETALHLMRQGRCRRLPVVNAEGNLAGLISLDDILGAITDEFTEISHLLEEESPQSLANETVEDHLKGRLQCQTATT